mmetsp:Transcript_54611/g.119553  ORF Transcript_54611/g.119553 Transcript_54611/m.119553 type:complete len:196 (+) Transcript_54611:65-652(+)
MGCFCSHPGVFVGPSECTVRNLSPEETLKLLCDISFIKAIYVNPDPRDPLISLEKVDGDNQAACPSLTIVEHHRGSCKLSRTTSEPLPGGGCFKVTTIIDGKQYHEKDDRRRDGIAMTAPEIERRPNYHMIMEAVIRPALGPGDRDCVITITIRDLQVCCACVAKGVVARMMAGHSGYLAEKLNAESERRLRAWM